VSRAGELARRVLGRPVAQRSGYPGLPANTNTDNYFGYNGVAYWGNPVGLASPAQERIASNFEGLIKGALHTNPAVWACEQRRLNVFTEARFLWRSIEDGVAGDLHNRVATRLEMLRRPWTNGTTGQLLARMLLHRDFAGNAFVVDRGAQLKVPRPDWMFIVVGTNNDAEQLVSVGDPDDLDAEVVAYGYWPGGPQSGRDPVLLLPDEVAHFPGEPDPLAHYRGMSWLTPLVRELEADGSATEHKLQFFRNGATLQTIVTLDKDMDTTAFKKMAGALAEMGRGLSNAYKTWFIGGGADVKVVGADLQQLDFTALQGKAETRIAAAAGVPPLIAGLSEGLQAASYHDYGPAKRAFVDGTIRQLWRDACGCLETIAGPPNGSQLWIDDRDIPYLRDDALDIAEIMAKKATILQILTNSGWKPDAAVKAVMAMDERELLGAHSGLFSVQLQPPGPAAPPPAPGGSSSIQDTTKPAVGPPDGKPAMVAGGPTNGRPMAIAAKRAAGLRAIRQGNHGDVKG
jgi:phage portal protein BeeE